MQTCYYNVRAKLIKKQSFKKKKKEFVILQFQLHQNCTRSSQIVINSELPLLWKNVINYHLKLQKM